ncbi:MAG: MFS transporter [Candidatus Brocadiia bacterium]
MFAWLRPRESLEEGEVARGLRSLLFDGMASQAMGVLTSGAFLVAFALLLGASNKAIGLLAAIGPFAQALQIPAVFLVDRLRVRKAVVVLGSFLSRSAWVLIALVPFAVPEEYRLTVFLVALFAFFGLGAISTCAFSSWMRDLVPESTMGSYFAKRLAGAIAVGAGLSLLAGFGVDLYRQHFPEREIAVYSILFGLGTVFGMVGLWFLGRVPEPRMTAAPTQGFLATLARPFRDRGFRTLLVFLGTWNFAITLAAPFFAVYMLRRLELRMGYIISLAVLSQLVNVAFLRIWGRLADRFTNKSVLTVSGPLFLVSIVLWPFLTMPEPHALTVPLLVVIHVLAGMSSAGVTLCAGNIALKAAPRGTATAYLATNALTSGLAATVGPLLGGLTADWFANRELSLTLRWATLTDGAAAFELPAISLRGLDFLFILSFVLGLYAIHRLLAVKEAGEVEERVVMSEFYGEVRKMAQHVSNVPGLRYLTVFPYERVKDAIGAIRPRDDAELESPEAPPRGEGEGQALGKDEAGREEGEPPGQEGP